MGHLAEENSISIGFCGGFYCHMDCNAASEGLYGLPRKISGARCGGNPAEEKKKSSGLHNRTSNKLLSVTELRSRPDLFLHVTRLPLCLLSLLYSAVGLGLGLKGVRATLLMDNVHKTREGM